MQKWIILIAVCIIVVLGGFVIFNSDVETEYVPEEEIREDEMRNTIVSLYFQDKNTKELVKETKLIDSKRLLKNPYEELIKLLMDGPENINYEKAVPSNAKLLSAQIKGNCVTIDFSKDFIDNSKDDKQKYNSIYSILNTLAELTEVESIKIIIDGQENDGYADIGLNFKEKFYIKKDE